MDMPVKYENGYMNGQRIYFKLSYADSRLILHIKNRHDDIAYLSDTRIQRQLYLDYSQHNFRHCD